LPLTKKKEKINSNFEKAKNIYDNFIFMHSTSCLFVFLLMLSSNVKEKEP